MSTEVRTGARGGLVFEESKRRLERAKRTIPGGVHSNIRLSELPWPALLRPRRGSHLYDVDGNDLHRLRARERAAPAGPLRRGR